MLSLKQENKQKNGQLFIKRKMNFNKILFSEAHGYTFWSIKKIIKTIKLN